MKTSFNKFILLLSALALSVALIGCGGSSDSLADVVAAQQQSVNEPTGPAPVLSFRVVNTFPHQTDAFTQGLLFENNFLYESNGLVGQSNLREVDLTTGNVVRQQNLPNTVFGEGLASRNGTLLQLTLNSGQVFLWNRDTFVQTEIRPISNPAWGLTQVGESTFAFSNGTSEIRFLSNSTNLTETGRITVTDNGQEVDLLNELEFINGLLFANRFTTDEIVAINPNTGIVAFRIDLTGIIDKQANGLGINDVLNGIAFDPVGNRLFVTGKRWPSLFQIEIVQ